MDLISVITLLGGLAFFLYGMKVMSDGLEKSANGRFNRNLKKVAENRFFAMLFGAGVTVAVQSSSAVTVMLVGLVNSGILEFNQTVGMLMGANVGKTLTAWILSLAGISSDNVWVNLLKPANLAFIFAIVGTVMIMLKRKQRLQNLGNTFLGFSVLMFGMNLMSSAMEPLSTMPEFTNLLTAFKNPLIAVLIGAVFTGIIQSSAASVGILQALSMTGGITYGMAIPIIMGQNIGTCVTAVISSFGVNRGAKKVALTHLSINILGTLILMIPFYISTAIFDLTFMHMEISPFMIAVVHSIFNILTTIVLFPFTKLLVRIANILIPDRDKNDTVMLDDRLLTVPPMAVQKSLDVVSDMSAISKQAFQTAIGLFAKYDEAEVEKVLELENTLDTYEDHLSTYMMKLSKISVADNDARGITKILHTIDDFERIGDHSRNFVKSFQELHDNDQLFSDDANAEMAVLTDATQELLNITTTAFQTNDIDLASSVEPLRQVISNLVLVIKRNHTVRLQNGECSPEMGFSLNNFLTDYERVAGHCSNIAVAVIETKHGTFDTHEYLSTIRQEDENYKRKFKAFSEQFSL